MLGAAWTSFFKPMTALSVGCIRHDVWAQSLNNMSKVSRPAKVAGLPFFKACVLFYLMKLVAAMEREAAESRKPTSFR